MQLAKLVGDIATGQIPPPTADEVRRVMSAMGKIGGPKGGAARAAKLSKQKRREIAKLGARIRWKKNS
jgi:hypothetical protein